MNGKGGLVSEIVPQEHVGKKGSGWVLNSPAKQYGHPDLQVAAAFGVVNMAFS